MTAGSTTKIVNSVLKEIGNRDEMKSFMGNPEKVAELRKVLRTKIDGILTNGMATTGVIAKSATARRTAGKGVSKRGSARLKQ